MSQNRPGQVVLAVTAEVLNVGERKTRELAVEGRIEVVRLGTCSICAYRLERRWREGKLDRSTRRLVNRLSFEYSSVS